MKYGDISNEIAPTILVNIDLILSKEEKKTFGIFKSKKLKLDINGTSGLIHLFNSGINVYLLCDSENYNITEVADILEKGDVPYTRILEAEEDNETIQMLLRQNFVHRLFYKKGVKFISILTVLGTKKIKQIDDLRLAYLEFKGW